MSRLDARVRYRLHQSFVYEYDGPVSRLVHRLVVVPPARYGEQVLRSAAVTVSCDDAHVSWTADSYGNRVCELRVPVVPRTLRMDVVVVAERVSSEEPVPVGLSADARFLAPTPLTAADARIAALARDIGAGAAPLELADRVCALVPQLVRYTPDATTVRTTAAEALAEGRGVCQDQAHLMLALLRAAGVPCRYVSGHLVGQGGTHAWVEVLAPAGRGSAAVAFDPCHARRADERYLTVAVGRDYADVPPTSGTYTGGSGRLTGSRELTLSRCAA